MKHRLPLLTLLPAFFLLCECKERDGSPGANSQIATSGDMAFAKSTFDSLAKGELSVARDLDWNTLTIFGKDLGADYLSLPSEVAKEKFRTAFISNFATSFRESGGDISSLKNWRVVLTNEMKTEVAADSPNGVLSITTMEKDGAKKVVSLVMTK